MRQLAIETKRYKPCSSARGRGNISLHVCNTHIQIIYLMHPYKKDGNTPYMERPKGPLCMTEMETPRYISVASI